jgi:hypothetical protein
MAAKVVTAAAAGQDHGVVLAALGLCPHPQGTVMPARQCSQAGCQTCQRTGLGATIMGLCSPNKCMPHKQGAMAVSHTVKAAYSAVTGWVAHQHALVWRRGRHRIIEAAEAHVSR